MEHYNEVYSKEGKKWDAKPGLWIGDHFPVSNSSLGYHGIMKQWWEYYTVQPFPKVLLFEGKKAKEDFQKVYPYWIIETFEGDDELHPDIMGDICNSYFNPQYDLIICQATFEHLYDPFGAFKNLVNALNPGGILMIHTHAPEMAYHQVPRDYFRFMKDWWYDLPKYFPVELMELMMVNNKHVFACYRRNHAMSQV